MDVLNEINAYLGVLLAFLVLCLFNRKSNNFLLALLLELGKDYIKELNEYISELKSKITSIYDKRTENSESRVSELTRIIEKAGLDRKLNERLMFIFKESRLLEHKFFNEATLKSSSFDPRQIAQKSELSDIAMFTLVLVSVVMLVTLLDFLSTDFRLLFISFLIGYGSVFSALLYGNFFKTHKNKEVYDTQFKKAKKIKMIISVIFSFFMYNIFSCIINEPLLSYLSFPFICSLILFRAKRKRMILCDAYNKYNKTYVFKHSIYIILFSLLCTIVINLLHSYYSNYNVFGQINLDDNIKDWYDTISYMKDKYFVKYILLLFSTLNTFILPLFFGYLYLRNQEEQVSLAIKCLYEEYKDKMIEYENDFKMLEREIRLKASIVQNNQENNNS